LIGAAEVEDCPQAAAVTKSSANIIGRQETRMIIAPPPDVESSPAITGTHWGEFGSCRIDESLGGNRL
jgi:hypothetical protein